MWPEDEIDFEDGPADIHGGDSLTVAELAATHPHLLSDPDLVVKGGRTRTVRVKKPCGGSVPPEKKHREVMLSPGGATNAEFVELKERQDKLAKAVEVAIEHLGKRMDQVEKQGTPFWLMSSSQKNVLVVSVAVLGFLMIMGVLAVAFRTAGIPL